MTPKPSSDTGFQIVATAEPGYDAFRIAVAMTTVKPGTAVAAGTTYTAATLPFKPREAEGWGDYVAGRREVADSGYIWQNFVRALPTTPTVAEGEFHRTFGRTFVHSYDDLIANTRPDRGDVIEVAAGTVMTGWDGSASTGTLVMWDGATEGADITVHDARVVLDCTENDLGQGLCEVKVRTVQNAQVTITEDSGIDSETGQIVTQEQTHTLTSTRPTGASTDDTGYYTLVKKQEHNWWVSTRAKSVTGPINEATATLWTKTERSPVYWPPVLVSHEFVAILDPGSDYWHKRFNYSLKAAYTGDVKVHYSQWWQKTPPTEISSTEMLPTAISIRREWSESINVDACLHPAILVTEDAYAGLYPFAGFPATGFLQQINYAIPATNVADWPDVVVKLDVEPSAGGFKCLKRVIEKPESTVAGVTITLQPWTSGGYIFTDY